MGDKTLPHKPDKIEKPWGYELIWARTDHYAGKVLHVKRGESLSYQYHRVKDESIHILHGSMELETEVQGERVKQRLELGDCVHIPPGTKHRMLALDDCDILEVSTSELDDVVRLEDRYGRTGRKSD
jgi:mannose-6-phosphate isomerase